MATPENPHDQVLYPAGTFDQTHPNRLATLATLFGMRPAPVDRCRVLELGCGRGTNLVPMAEALPGSTFVGVDLAPRPIAEAREWTARLGLTNLTFVCGDILALDPEPGSYDYILAHGVYSWVPPEVQERLLAILRRGLAPEGVGYVSYNALPGCYLRKALRDLMLYHTRGIDSPERRIAQSRAIASFIADASPASAGNYKRLMEGQRDRLGRLTNEYVFHDDLCDSNEAVYFHEFMERAGRHQLQYLAETSFSDMQSQALAPEARQMLHGIGNIVAYEQYLDFLVGRAFRRTLLVHEEASLDRVLGGERMRPFFAAAASTPVAPVPDLRAEAVERFENAAGLTMGLGSPLARAAMRALCDASPVALSFDELLETARARLRPARPDQETDAMELGELLLATYGGDMVKLCLHRPAMVKKAGERPVARAIARLQAGQGPAVTNLWHCNVKVEDAPARRLIGLLDGTRDRAALVAALAAAVMAGEVDLVGDEGPLQEAGAVLRYLEAHLEGYLDRLGDLALLEA
jgi:SAM-dependent methyltransferase